MAPQGFLSIDFLDVGQGDGTFMVWPDDTTILVDMGSKKNADVAGAGALKYVHDKLLELQARRHDSQPTIDRLFITHGDGDHYNLIPTLIDSFKDNPSGTLRIMKTAIGGELADYDKSIRDALLDQALRDSTLTIFPPQDHDAADKPPGWIIDDGGIYLLSVNVPAVKGPKNAKSICLMVVYAGRKVILMGDAEATTEGYILDWYPGSPSFLKCDGLKLGHHGSQVAASDNWLKATRPWCVFVSSDQKWAHPYCSTLQRVIDNGSIERDEPHTWLCGKGANASKQYYFWNEDESNKTYDIYTNLAYQKFLTADTEAERKLIEQINKDNDPDGVLPDGIVLGVQYSFQVEPNGAVRILATDFLDDVTAVVATDSAGSP